MAKPLGYVVKRARYDEYGRGGGMRLYPVNGGPYYKPPPQGKQQKAQGKQQKVFAKDRVPKNLRNDSYYLQKVDEARGLGIPDSEIFDFLNRKEKLTVAKIKRLFKIDSILLGVIPESFRNIEGGANAGLDLFLDSEQYEDLKKSSFWGGAIYGLAESLPALLTPTGKAGSLISKAGNFQRVANLVTLTSSFIDEEIANNPYDQEMR